MKRNRSLDVLRGVAVLLVIGHHHPYFPIWHRAGGVGVDLFFVLSGFLISGLLFSEYKRSGRIDFLRFFIRRGFKIYPAYYFFLFLLAFLRGRPTLADLIFMQSYWPYSWGHTWSLSVEEHFYIALPLVLMLSMRFSRCRNFSWIPYAFPVVLIACLAMRIALGPGASERQIYNPTHLRIDALFAGVTLGWLYHFTRVKLIVRHRHVALVLSLLLIAPTVFVEGHNYALYTVGLTALLLGFSLLLVWALNSPWLAHLKAIATVGKYSYSIYLWHWPIAVFFAWQWRNSLLTFTAYLLTTLAVGWAMSKMIEEPMLRLRERLVPSVRNYVEANRKGLTAAAAPARKYLILGACGTTIANGSATHQAIVASDNPLPISARK